MLWLVAMACVGGCQHLQLADNPMPFEMPSCHQTICTPSTDVSEAIKPTESQAKPQKNPPLDDGFFLLEHWF